LDSSYQHQMEILWSSQIDACVRKTVLVSPRLFFSSNKEHFRKRHESLRFLKLAIFARSRYLSDSRKTPLFQLQSMVPSLVNRSSRWGIRAFAHYRMGLVSTLET